MLKGDLVHVVWLDAEVNNEWTDEKDLHDHSNLVCESVGFVVKKASKTKPVLVIASTRAKDDKGKYEYNAITKIPYAWIKELNQLEKEQE